jgi:curli biogenesis system outer membrane secretion channel CsgG
MRNRLSHLIAAALTVATAASAHAAGPKDTPAAEIPTCDRRLGTLTIAEPENAWWVGYHLESPEALIKVFVGQSRCFTLLDRGRGMAAAQAERALAASGQVRVGSNVGKGQMKAADYVLVPDIVNRNNNAKGRSFGGMLGGWAGAALGGINITSKTADVVLSLTDVRSTEQLSLQQGHAEKKSINWGGGAAGWSGLLAAAGASSYTNTDIGQVLAQAYLDAFVKMVDDVKASQPDAKANNVGQSVTMRKPGKMYTRPDIKAPVVRDLEPGMTLYPTDEKQGIWWKVSDELGNEGWVPSPLFGLAR